MTAEIKGVCPVRDKKLVSFCETQSLQIIKVNEDIDTGVANGTITLATATMLREMVGNTIISRAVVYK